MTVSPRGFDSRAASGAEQLDVSRAGGQQRLMDAHRGGDADGPSSDPTDKAATDDPTGAQAADGQPDRLAEGDDADHKRARDEAGHGFSQGFVQWAGEGDAGRAREERRD